MTYIDSNLDRLARVARYLKLNFPDFENDFQNNMFSVFTKPIKHITFHIKPEYNLKYKYKLPIIDVSGLYFSCSLINSDLDITISSEYESLFEFVYSEYEYDDDGDRVVDKLIYQPFKNLDNARNLESFIFAIVKHKDKIENFPNCFSNYIKDRLLFQ